MYKYIITCVQIQQINNQKCVPKCRCAFELNYFTKIDDRKRKWQQKRKKKLKEMKIKWKQKENSKYENEKMSCNE